jgi:hypothetical protein
LCKSDSLRGIFARIMFLPHKAQDMRDLQSLQSLQVPCRLWASQVKEILQNLTAITGCSSIRHFISRILSSRRSFFRRIYSMLCEQRWIDRNFNLLCSFFFWDWDDNHAWALTERGRKKVERTYRRDKKDQKQKISIWLI